MEESILTDGQSQELCPSYLAAVGEVSVDIATVRAAIAGDAEAFSTLFLLTYRQMYYTVRRFLKREADIGDALQTGYTKAWKYIGRLDPPENFMAWLRRIMENAAKDVLRDVCENAVYDPETEAVAPDDIEQRERTADIRAVLQSLDRAHVRVLTLYYYDGLKLREIAALEGIPLSTAHHRLGQARRALMNALLERGIDSPLYGAEAAGALAVLLRTAIGTDVLCAAAAQEMLVQVLGDNAAAVAARQVLVRNRNRAVGRLAALVAGLSVFVTCLAVIFMWRPHDVLPGAASSTPSAVQTTVTTMTVTTTVDAAQTTQTATQTDTTVDATADTTVNTTASTVSVTDTATAASTAPTTGATKPPVPPFVPDYREGYANTRTSNSLVRAASWDVQANLIFPPHYLDFQDGWVYRTDGCKFRKDGTGEVVRFCDTDYLYAMSVVGDWVYYLDASGVCRVRTDGAVTECVVPCNGTQKRYIDGFAVYDGLLFYSLHITDGFGGFRSVLHVYDPDTGMDETVEGVNFSLVAVVMMEDGWLDMNRFGNSGAYVFDPETRTMTERFSSGMDAWGSFGVYCTIGNTLYEGGEGFVYRYLSLDTWKDGFFTPEDAESWERHCVEFADASTGLLAVTLYEQQHPVNMVWYDPQTGERAGKPIPKAMWRTGLFQRFQQGPDGRVYLVAAQEEGCRVLFSCEVDGSGMIQY